MKQYFGPNQIVTKTTALKSYGVVFLVIAVFFAGWFSGRGQSPAKSEGKIDNVNNQGLVADSYGAEPDFQLFWDLWQKIKEEYVNQPVNEVDLFYGAMAGLMSALHDPYSQFFDPKTAKAFDEELSGSFSGIGVEIGIKNNALVVISPLEGSPGQLAGLKPGDQVLAIEDRLTFDINLDEAVSLIRGEQGTKVKLTILSKNTDKPRDISITRQKIENIGLRWEYLDSNIVHVKLSSFDTETENLLNKLVRELEEKGTVKGLILDLRNDPGGFLDMAIEVSSEWVEDGVLVSERDYKGNEKQHFARGRARLAGMETVVLVNEGSASASEIVAGALQDYKKAVLVGETTFGKGSVQKYELLEDGSAFRLTIGKWFTPLGRAIDEVGITPDYQVKLSEEDFNNDLDPQLTKALELFSD